MLKKRTHGATLLKSVLESVRPTYNAPLLVKGSFLFLSDFEIPYHNAGFINECFTIARAYNVVQCVWAGDAMHFEAFSPFPGNDSDADQELSEIDEYLPGFLEPFRRVFYFMGNHDDRPQRALDRKISNQKALRIALSDDTHEMFRRKVTMSEYYWCLADFDWQLEHQKNNSMIPGRVAQQLSAKFHKHIITGHTHKVGATKQNGLWAIDAGCGVDVKRLAYPNLRHSTHTEMENGAVLMLARGGQYVPLHLIPERMDFELWRAKRG